MALGSLSATRMPPSRRSATVAATVTQSAWRKKVCVCLCGGWGRACISNV